MIAEIEIRTRIVSKGLTYEFVFARSLQTE